MCIQNEKLSSSLCCQCDDDPLFSALFSIIACPVCRPALLVRSSSACAPILFAHYVTARSAAPCRNGVPESLLHFTICFYPISHVRTNFSFCFSFTSRRPRRSGVASAARSFVHRAWLVVRRKVLSIRSIVIFFVVKIF